jgi:hypothetical protein
MRNGNFIESGKEIDESLLSYYFGKKYDYYNRNNNWFVAGVLGPVYIFSHNFYFVGFLLFLLDLAITMGFFILNHMFLFTKVVRLINVVYLVVNRFVWASIGNMIYLKLLNRKLKKIMKSNPDNYKEIIQDIYRLDNMLTGLKYVVYGIISLVAFFIVREIVYSYLLIS